MTGIKWREIPNFCSYRVERSTTPCVTVSKTTIVFNVVSTALLDDFAATKMVDILEGYENGDLKWLGFHFHNNLRCKTAFKVQRNGSVSSNDNHGNNLILSGCLKLIRRYFKEADLKRRYLVRYVGKNTLAVMLDKEPENIVLPPEHREYPNIKGE